MYFVGVFHDSLIGTGNEKMYAFSDGIILVLVVILCSHHILPLTRRWSQGQRSAAASKSMLSTSVWSIMSGPSYGRIRDLMTYSDGSPER